MPELPEVEVARLAIEPCLTGQIVRHASCRTPRLRVPLDPELTKHLRNRMIVRVDRRGKYLLFECAHNDGKQAGPASGWLIIHLGMSGTLRICPVDTPAQAHDHFDLVFSDRLLRFCDPRRFGLVVWHPENVPDNHPLLAGLGPEPFADDIDAAWLQGALTGRRGPIKPALMDNRLLVGVGNIYASESLFRAGISPLRAANQISRQRCGRLLAEIRITLHDAIAAGGSSLRDYVHLDGSHGCFQLAHAVYGREGEACPKCGKAIRQIRQAGRSTYYCPGCQH